MLSFQNPHTCMWIVVTSTGIGSLSQHVRLITSPDAKTPVSLRMRKLSLKSLLDQHWSQLQYLHELGRFMRRPSVSIIIDCVKVDKHGRICNQFGIQNHPIILLRSTNTLFLQGKNCWNLRVATHRNIDSRTVDHKFFICSWHQECCSASNTEKESREPSPFESIARCVRILTNSVIFPFTSSRNLQTVATLQNTSPYHIHHFNSSKILPTIDPTRPAPQRISPRPLCNIETYPCSSPSKPSRTTIAGSNRSSSTALMLDAPRQFSVFASRKIAIHKTKALPSKTCSQRFQRHFTWQPALGIYVAHTYDAYPNRVLMKPRSLNPHISRLSQSIILF